MESLKVSITLPVSAEKLYKAWLNSKEHSLFTGEPGKRIVQSWRTSEFPDDAPDSTLEITLEEKAGKTKLNLYHHGLQKGDGKKYKQGWKDHYFTPMKSYFKK